MLATHVSILTFACDVLLVGSLSYVLITWWRAPGFATWSRHAGDIEALLRKAVREADVATKVLGERITGEKTSVERLLIEVEDVKERLTKLLANAEAVEQVTPARTPRAGATANENSTVEAKESRREADFNSSLEREVTRSRVVEEEEEYIPAAKSATKTTAPQGKKRVNIYGEEITDEPAPSTASQNLSQARSAIQAYAKAKTKSAPVAAAAPKRRGLAAQIEREQYDSHEVRAKGLEEAIADAEKLIRRGAPVKSVVESTQMAEEDVKMISRAISEALKKDMPEEETEASFDPEQSELDKILEQNREAHAQVLTTPGLDPRLGVLNKNKSTGRLSTTI
jgi:hypothetical protein